ncbi:MAG: hypothetical protein LBC68_07015 [Prevotellaceae bacterium]|jgi:hypothetical protein|nr:hypothetical protein [Prevotellaceae bacterium]
MNKAATIFLLFCVFFPRISTAQTSIDSLILNCKKIDFENLKRMSDRFYSNAHDCDSLSTGTTIEKRYCLNVRLQREDSLLNKKLNDIIEKALVSKNDTLFIQQLKITLVHDKNYKQVM